MKQQEEWRDIPGYAGWYQASNAGRVRSWHNLNGQGRSKSPHIMREIVRQGCVRIGLHDPDTGKKSVVSVASVIYKTWVGEIPPGKRVCHKSLDAGDNKPGNLILADLRLMARQMNIKKNGAHNRMPVIKMDTGLTVVAVYPSARQAEKKNFFGVKTLADYCNLKRTTVIAGDGFIYAWDDDKWLRKTLQRARAELDALGIRYNDPHTEEYYNLPPEPDFTPDPDIVWIDTPCLCAGGGVHFQNRSVRA